MADKYINATKALKALKVTIADSGEEPPLMEEIIEKLFEALPAADVVEVVRCKDCIYFQPDFVLTDSGERRPYTKKEKESLFGGLVDASKGINCGSRCERYEYWEENGIPVWFNENDFCSYGKRKADNE